MATLYPLSWFTLPNEAECEPVHSTACVAAGESNRDPEVSVYEVSHDDAEEAMRRAGQPLPSADEPEEGVRADRFFIVGADSPEQVGRLVHLSMNGVARRV